MKTTNKTTVKISNKLEMVGFIRTLGTSSAFISMLTETEVDMVKKDRETKAPNPYLGAVKVERRNGLVNVNFVAAVERNMEKAGVEEPSYVAGSTWYIHESTEEGKPLPLCVHKKDVELTEGKRFYIQYFPLRSIGAKRYFLNGKEMTPEQVQDMKRFEVVKTKSDFKPIVLTFSMDSIRELKARKIVMLNHTISRLKERLSGISKTVGFTINSDQTVGV